MTTLLGRRPELNGAELIAGMRVPPHFVAASFDNYRPDPSYPSQAQARERLVNVGRKLGKPWSASPVAIYLDGGYGVGKTHLLAALAHSVGPKAVFGTFMEYTALVGALGYQATASFLRHQRLVCIDEFELDDVADTLLMTRLIKELLAQKTSVVATSNTLPESLGEGRFAAADFRREIQGLADAFEIITIDGPDYRHHGGEFTGAELNGEVGANGSAQPRAQSGLAGRQIPAAWDRVDFSALLDDLAQVHPSAYRAYVAGTAGIWCTDVIPVTEHFAALRLVALVDRLYEADVPLVAVGHELADIFPSTLLGSGYRKKYLRCLSRLVSLQSAGEKYLVAN